jgi:hypothetical protein
LVPEACDPDGAINDPDGFVSQDGQFLHFGFDNNRRQCVYDGAKLPSMPR